jgi:hypothetical protein
MARAPHIEIARRRESDAEFAARRAQLEAKYGVPYDKLPDVLRWPEPEHPRGDGGRRFDYRTTTGYRWNYRARSDRRPFLADIGPRDRRGWRSRRRAYLVRLEERRQAEIVVRGMLAKRTGRGKLFDRKAHVHARERIEAREWRDEL